MKCMLDMDGVIVDFVKGAAIHHRRDPEEILSQQFAHDELVAAFDMSPHEFWNPLGEDFWAELEPYPEFERVMKLIEDRFGRRNVCLLSSPTRHRGCMPGKLRWIKRHLPDYKRRFLFGPSKEFCAAHNRILIDDKPANIDKFVVSGGKGFLVPRPWNQHRDGESVWVETLARFLGVL